MKKELSTILGALLVSTAAVAVAGNAAGCVVTTQPGCVGCCPGWVGPGCYGCNTVATCYGCYACTTPCSTGCASCSTSS